MALALASPLLTILLFFFLLPNPLHSKPIKALVTPITKHSAAAHPLYSISLHSNPNRSFVIDLSIPVPWTRCPTRNIPKHPILCGTPICSAAQSSSPSCSVTGNQFSADKQRSSLPCMCAATLVNPISQSENCTSSVLASTTLSLPSTDGHNPLSDVNVSHVAMGCAPTTFLNSLPRGVSGLATLSRSPLSIPSQLTGSTFKFAKQFAICLPSTDSDSGVAFFGSGPFFLLPPPGRNVTALLQFTPFVNPPVKNDFGYYIGVKGMAINGKAVKLQTNSLGFDAHGHGGVLLSTVTPYTAMRTNIYKPFLKQYASATSGIPRVNKVAPFDLCLNTSQLGSTRVGLPVPQVDLQLTAATNWTMFGFNTFKQVADDVACLAFVDGGRKAQQAVVIGSFQIENNFLLFDLVESRLGFSSLLFFFQTTCGNFNFTSGV